MHKIYKQWNICNSKIFTVFIEVFCKYTQRIQWKLKWSGVYFIFTMLPVYLSQDSC